MAKKLWVYIDMFDINQKISVADDGKIIDTFSTPIDEVTNTVSTLASNDDDIAEIEINGNAKFIHSIGDMILTELKSKYSNNNVRVKVNGKVFD